MCVGCKYDTQSSYRHPYGADVRAGSKRMHKCAISAWKVQFCYSFWNVKERRNVKHLSRGLPNFEGHSFHSGVQRWCFENQKPEKRWDKTHKEYLYLELNFDKCSTAIFILSRCWEKKKVNCLWSPLHVSYARVTVCSICPLITLMTLF